MNLRPALAQGLPSAVLGFWGPTPCPSRLSPPPGSCQDCSAQSRPPVASPSHRPGRSDSIQVPGVAGHWPGAGSGARAASPHAVQAKRAGLGSGEWVPSCCSPGSVCAVPWPGPAHPCPRPASTRGALLRSRGWRQGLPVRDRAATCRPQPQPHNGALVRGRPAGGGQRLPAHPGLRAPLCGVVARAGSTEPDGQAPPELGRGAAGPVPPAPCGSWPSTPLRRRWGLPGTRAACLGPLPRVSGLHLELGTGRVPPAAPGFPRVPRPQLPTAGRRSVDTKAAPGAVLLLPGRVPNTLCWEGVPQRACWVRLRG